MTTAVATKDNYSMFIDTVKTLASSQGFYSRIASQLDEMSEDELDALKDDLNNQPQFKDAVDIVLFLEQ